jgi:prepilin-type N-terminal cleavage/methylation domain-containing protein
MRNVANRRSGFTLLEMLLALAIGVLLMTGLYFALNIQMMATQSGRLQVDQAGVASGVLDVFEADIKRGLAALDTYAAAAASSTSSTSSTSSAATTVPMTYAFNFCVQGESDYCSIFINRVPKAIAQSQSDANQPGSGDMQYTETDLCRITYYLLPGTGGDGSGGLVRQEISAVTAADQSMNTLPPSGLDDFSKILSHEVLALGFEYWDGTSWLTSWNGQNLAPTASTSTGTTPTGPVVGPPLLIRITISIARADNLSAEPGDASVRQYQHVIQIPTASNFNGMQNMTGG